MFVSAPLVPLSSFVSSLVRLCFFRGLYFHLFPFSFSLSGSTLHLRVCFFPSPVSLFICLLHVFDVFDIIVVLLSLFLCFSLPPSLCPVPCEIPSVFLPWSWVCDAQIDCRFLLVQSSMQHLPPRIRPANPSGVIRKPARGAWVCVKLFELHFEKIGVRLGRHQQMSRICDFTKSPSGKNCAVIHPECSPHPFRTIIR
jgi:hypothetical protein